jgi:hypothetical protein
MTMADAQARHAVRYARSRVRRRTHLAAVVALLGLACAVAYLGWSRLPLTWLGRPAEYSRERADASFRNLVCLWDGPQSRFQAAHCRAAEVYDDLDSVFVQAEMSNEESTDLMAALAAAQWLSRVARVEVHRGTGWGGLPGHITAWEHPYWVAPGDFADGEWIYVTASVPNGGMHGLWMIRSASHRRVLLFTWAA